MDGVRLNVCVNRVVASLRRQGPVIDGEREKTTTAAWRQRETRTGRSKAKTLEPKTIKRDGMILLRRCTRRIGNRVWHAIVTLAGLGHDCNWMGKCGNPTLCFGHVIFVALMPFCLVRLRNTSNDTIAVHTLYIYAPLTDILEYTLQMLCKHQDSSFACSVPVTALTLERVVRC
jgi:hypothetical protein